MTGVPWGSALAPVLFIAPSSVKRTAGSRAPSAHLMMTPSCVVQSNLLKGGSAIQKGLERLETGPQEPPEAQQGQLQCPGQGLGQSQVQIQDEQGLDSEQHCRQSLGGVGRQEIQYEPPMCPCCLESQSCSGLHHEVWPAG